MAREEAKTAEELTAAIRSLVDKALESQVREQIVARGRDLASTLTSAGESAAERAGEAWRESEPMRRDAADAALRASRDTVSWGRRRWAGWAAEPEPRQSGSPYSLVTGCRRSVRGRTGTR